MKKVILLILFFPYLSFGQVSDDFENGAVTGWTESVINHWKADSSGSLNGRFSLHHFFDNPSSGSDCIGRPLSTLHPADGTTRWIFSIRHGYDPSSSNSWSVFLMSDREPSAFANGSDVSGFAAGVNLSGYDDTLRLWKIKKGFVSVVVTCPVNWQADISTSGASTLIAERNSSGEWNLAIYKTGNILVGTASGFDNELFDAAWLLINYRYTSTRDRLLWFDDLKIEGVFYADTTPPQITGNRITGKNSIELTVSENPADIIMESGQYSLNNGAIRPVTIRRKTTSVYEICFVDDFINKTRNTLTIKTLCDRSGNCSTNTIIEFTPSWPEPGDVIISEIMADPFPSVSLPEKEYLEIMNRTEFSFVIENWSLTSENQKTIIPVTGIRAGEIVILSSVADTSLFGKYGKTSGLKSFPSLTDEGRILSVTDSSGHFIHGVEYTSKWYDDRLKSNGGWSLEMIDTDFPFYGDGNWEASSSAKGGTPGKINSASRINRDQDFYGIENVFPDDTLTVTLSLSETNFTLDGQADQILVDEKSVKSALPSDPLLRKFKVRLNDKLTERINHTLFITGDLYDFAGNEITKRSFKFGLPEISERGEIVINEILFNPFPGEPDFIELFNTSEKVVDASGLYLASINVTSGDTSEVYSLSVDHRCIMPGSFYVATADRNSIIDRYPGSVPENIFNSAVPSMPDDRGHLLLLNRRMEIIDEVIYSDDMHYSLLDGTEGVSLEKIRKEIPSAESMSWHSASESSGWGTPGSENSVFSQAPVSNDQISFSSGRISPDNDGYEDVLVIDLDPEGAGNVVTITIFDETGSYIRRLAENFFAGEKASVVWNATADDGSVVDSGIYIVLIELFNDKGKTKSWKKVCAVVK